MSVCLSVFRSISPSVFRSCLSVRLCFGLVFQSVCSYQWMDAGGATDVLIERKRELQSSGEGRNDRRRDHGNVFLSRRLRTEADVQSY